MTRSLEKGFRTILPSDIAVSVSGTDAAPETLFPEEMSPIERAVPRRKIEFALGRTCARRALAELGVPPTPIPTNADRSPRWPPGICGSITHSKSIVVAAVAFRGYAGIGIDVEPGGPLEPDLVNHVCTNAEQAALRRDSGDIDLQMAKIVFCAKEAVYKCFYPSIRKWIGFEEVEIDIDKSAGTFAVDRVYGETLAEWFAMCGRHLSGRFFRTEAFIAAAATLKMDHEGCG